MLYLLGSLCYIDDKRSLEESLCFFDAAIDKDSDHQWAILSRAYCLHDLERWTDAATAYDKVNAACFMGRIVWRYELLLEQRAYCTFRSGSTESALAQFESMLNRWLANPQLAFGLMGLYMAKVATGEFRNPLSTRYAELLENDDCVWLCTANRVSIHAEENETPDSDVGDIRHSSVQTGYGSP
jgi:tetratricopeptide (TPR) repeat protein